MLLCVCCREAVMCGVVRVCSGLNAVSFAAVFILCFETDTDQAAAAAALLFLGH